MIAAIEGVLEARGPDWVQVRVGGLSLRLAVPAFTLEALPSPGERVRLRTHLHLREDIIALYGFATGEEVSLFELLIEVPRVGPKLALALLSAFRPERLAQAIASEEVALLSQVPGVGKKTASRLALELKDKLGPLSRLVGTRPVGPGSAEVIAALAALGYTAMEAAQAAARLPADADLSLEEKVRLALRHFGGG